MGQSRFIWIYGVLVWGLGTGIVWSLAMAATLGWDLPTLLPVSLIFFPIGGYFSGVRFWKRLETQYLEATETESDEVDEVEVVDEADEVA